MRIVSVVGARPQFVKLAPIAHAFQGRVEHLIVHTGQHYDELLSGTFFKELGIPQPTVNLGVGSGSHAQQTAAMMVALERFLLDASPDWVLVYGDTNSTVSAAMVAAKLNLRLAHLEAGLRSRNRAMPEEINRIVADHLSQLNFAPSQIAVSNLEMEGLSDTSKLVGDVMVDVLNLAKEKVEKSPPSRAWKTNEGDYLFATLHRQELTESPEQLTAVLSTLGQMSLPVYLAAHPRLLKVMGDLGLSEMATGSLRIISPLGYLDLVDAILGSRGVITDSGGLQKEAYLLKVPCLTVRPETEWTETLADGWNTLVWHDLGAIKNFPIVKLPVSHNPMQFGDGTASHRILEMLISEGL